jgi:predicted O-methyltransferase YrrM
MSPLSAVLSEPTQPIAEADKTALHLLHKDLNAAYLKIARLEQKLELLTKKLRPNRDESAPAEVAAVSRLVDLSHPDNLCRALAENSSFEISRPPLRHRRISPETTARVRALWQTLPEWVQGAISCEDAGFLDGLIREVRPDQVYEIGVASGASSTVILTSMAAYADPSRTWLYSYDIATDCYFDPSHAVGEATRTMVPALLKQWKLDLRGTALDVPREKPSQTKSLYFIDANHSHPWPVFDLIALLPGLQPGDVVVLHDVNLPVAKEGRFLDYGAQWLFEDWLGERSWPEVTTPNIGAIVVPENKDILLTSLVKTLSRPWPAGTKIDEDHLAACEKAFAAFFPRVG